MYVDVGIYVVITLGNLKNSRMYVDVVITLGDLNTVTIIHRPTLAHLVAHNTKIQTTDNEKCE